MVMDMKGVYVDGETVNRKCVSRKLPGMWVK